MEYLKRLDTEGENEYIARIYKNKIEYGLTNKEVCEVLNRELGNNKAESTYRSVAYPYIEGYDNGYEKALRLVKHEENDNKIENTLEEDSFIQELREEKRAIKEERYKLQTEKLENNRWIREKARIDLFAEKIQEAIDKLEPFSKPTDIKYITSKLKDGILPIGDPHYGKEIFIKGLKGETLNEYNDKIFEARMWELLELVKDIVLKENLTHLNVLLLGDLIDGILRMSQLQSLQYGIVDSTMKFAEFLSLWLNELSKIVFVDVYSALGNHSQIRPLGSKNGDFPHENMERIIMWYVISRLKDNSNIQINENENEFIFIDILGLKVMASHGEENNIEQAIKDYITLYGEKIDLFLSAHLHSKFEKSIGIGSYGDIEVQRVPSICGSDDFSMKLRKSARAGARLFIIEENKGKTITYDIFLN